MSKIFNFVSKILSTYSCEYSGEAELEDEYGKTTTSLSYTCDEELYNDIDLHELKIKLQRIPISNYKLSKVYRVIINRDTKPMFRVQITYIKTTF